MRRGLTLVHGYGTDVPGSIQSEGERLKELVLQHCAGPYENDGVKIFVYLFVEGKNGPPFKFYGIRSERPAKNGAILLVCAGIYVGRLSWEAPIEDYQQFLWQSLEKATWVCVEKLHKKNISFDDDKLRQHLSCVRAEFLRTDLRLVDTDSAQKSDPIPVDVYAENELHSVVIQYRIEGQGTMEDYDRRVKIETILDEFLSGSGLGTLDGGDIGTGTANIFCFLKPGRKGTEAIIETLRKSGFLDGAVIQETAAGEGRVVWPPGYTREFSVL